MPSGHHTDPEQLDSLYLQSGIPREKSRLPALPPQAHTLKPSGGLSQL